MRRSLFLSAFLFAAILSTSAILSAGDAAFEKTVLLPVPDKTGGMPLMEALANRRSERNVDPSRQLSAQELSNLLWATWGVNRPDGRRTAPTAKNTQNVGVCVAMENGVWWYDAPKNILELALDVDARARFGGAPVTLIYFAPTDDPAAGMHVGSLYQNAGLYCASAGLANVVKMTGADALEGQLALPDGYRVFVVQSIGYPR